MSIAIWILLLFVIDGDVSQLWWYKWKNIWEKEDDEESGNKNIK